MRFFKCDICGNFVEMISSSGLSMMCCGRKMTEIFPERAETGAEKHLPVCDMDGCKITVKVGSEPHPMMDAHFIEWIALETDKGAYRIGLKPNDEPKVTFVIPECEKVLRVYAYCNVHGLWMTECCNK